MDNLIANLRGEIGEVVTTWVLWRWLRLKQQKAAEASDQADFSDPDTAFLGILADKLRDDMVARLSELGEGKVGRLNFHFAAKKLGAFQSEASAFSKFVERSRFREKRNYDISHKELPEGWDDHKHIRIKYRDLIRATAMALRLMKRIDAMFLGPSSVYAWQHGRRRRYQLLNPARTNYILLPHVRLTDEQRMEVLAKELAEGRSNLEAVETTLNEEPVTVRLNRKWGIIFLDDDTLILPDYPVNSIGPIQRGQKMSP